MIFGSGMVDLARFKSYPYLRKCMSGAFDIAWALLKARDFHHNVNRPKEDRLRMPKTHPSTSYGDTNPSMTSQPSASLRTGGSKPQATEREMAEMMDQGELPVETRREMARRGINAPQHGVTSFGKSDLS